MPVSSHGPTNKDVEILKLSPKNARYEDLILATPVPHPPKLLIKTAREILSE
jgi:hypothetical protein